MTAAKPRTNGADGPAAPTITLAHLKYEQRGSTWTCEDEDWPVMLIGRRVYFGTGRILAQLTLARTDIRPARTILTGQVDLLVPTQRRNFAREAARRLKESSTAGEEALEAANSALMDALLERLLNAQNEIEIISATDIVVPDDLTPAYAVWPLVPRSRAGMLVGPSGQGKSGLGLLAAISVATGQRILERIEPRAEGPVFYIGQEEDAAQWGARLEMICRGHELAKPKWLYYLKLKGSSLIESAEMLAEQVASRKAVLVVIDSAQATWGSETEGVRDYATRYFNAVESLGTAVLVIEHPNLADSRKNGGSGGFAAGTSVKRDRVGHSWTLKSVAIAPAADHPYRYHVTLEDVKRNYVPKQDNITYETLVKGYEWMQFREADELSAESIVDSSSRQDDALAAIMREPDDTHIEYGWPVNELRERLHAKDDRRIRQALMAPYWRPANWNPGIRFRFDKVEGSGSNHITNPARFRLSTEIRVEDEGLGTGEYDGLDG